MARLPEFLLGLGLDVHLFGRRDGCSYFYLYLLFLFLFFVGGEVVLNIMGTFFGPCKSIAEPKKFKRSKMDKN